MKKKTLLAAAIVICLAVAASGTIAFFTAEDTAHNVITSGGVDIALQEWADEEKTTPFPEDGVSGIMPGAEVTKIVEVKNTGTGAAWIRVRVEKQIDLPEGVEGDVDLALMQLDFDESCWSLGEDGFYYYTQPLEPGAVTPALFASVRFDPGMGNLYQNSTARVAVTAYAVQAANNGETVFEAQGWPDA